MPLYEIMYIIQPEKDEEGISEAISRVNELLKREGGRIVSEKKMGLRKLAYEIDDFKEGYYMLTHVRAEAGIVPALEHFFKVNEGYLRFLVIGLGEEEEAEEDAETVEEPAEEAETAEGEGEAEMEPRAEEP